MRRRAASNQHASALQPASKRQRNDIQSATKAYPISTTIADYDRRMVTMSDSCDRARGLDQESAGCNAMQDLSPNARKHSWDVTTTVLARPRRNKGVS